MFVDEETIDSDVRYGIADCRKRLRSRRAALRTQHHPLTDVLNDEKVLAARGVESHAEILAALSMSQNSLSKLVDCLLGRRSDAPRERKEAVTT